MKTARAGRDGFVLVEAVVALTILAAVLLPLAGMSYQVASRSVRTTMEMLRAGAMTVEVGRLSVLPFDSLPAASGCTSVASQTLPYQRCVSVTDVTPKVRRVTVIVDPTPTMVSADTLVLRRTKPVTANPFGQ